MKFVNNHNVKSKSMNQEMELLLVELLLNVYVFSPFLLLLPPVAKRLTNFVGVGVGGAIQLVTITGQPNGIQVAVRLLYQRLEQEKQKREFFVSSLFRFGAFAEL